MDQNTFKWLRPYGRQFGNGLREGAWHVGRRKLLDFLLVYFKEGNGEIKIEGKLEHIGPGDLFWVPPNTFHEMWGHKPFTEISFVHFDLIYRSGGSDWDFTIPAQTDDLTPFGEMLHPPLPHGSLSKLKGKIEIHNSHHIGSILSEMASDALASKPNFEFRISGRLMEIIGELLSGIEGSHSRTSHPFLPGLERAAEFLSAGEGCPTIKEAAELAGLSQSHFRKLFKAQYQCSPKSWMMRSRMAKAKQLMGNPLLNLTQISVLCGFSNVHNFSREFSKSEGISPRQYRRFGGNHFQVETNGRIQSSKRVPFR